VSAARTERLAALLAEEGLDALIVQGAANLLYISGFSGSSGVALVGASGEPRLLTDFRYETQAAAEVGEAFAVEIVSGELLDALARTLPAGRVGFDDGQLSVRAHARFAELVPAHSELVAAGGLVERLRMVKDEAELGRMRAAAELIDDIYAWVLERGLARRTERDVALELEHELRRRGAEGPSFPSIVAGGAHAALPHASPRDVPIERGTLVLIDIGARLDDYCSDCTRTFMVGGAPDGRAGEVYELVLRAQQAGLDAIREGPTGADVDAAARAVIEAGGYGERFGHGLGHGVGIEIHEAPRLSRTGGEHQLRAGNVVTVEPGVYLPGSLGVRIEDLVVVTADGHEVLSRFTKELLTVE
jgi:Xaa-Pro aminopeptidase